MYVFYDIYYYSTLLCDIFISDNMIEQNHQKFRKLYTGTSTIVQAGQIVDEFSLSKFLLSFVITSNFIKYLYDLKKYIYITWTCVRTWYICKRKTLKNTARVLYVTCTVLQYKYFFFISKIDTTNGTVSLPVCTSTVPSVTF